MPTFVMRKGELVDARTAPPLVQIHGSAPYVISDAMSPTLHHADGRTYESKRQFRDVTRAHGCVEIGNERQTPRAPAKLDKRKRREDIKRALWQVKNA